MENREKIKWTDEQEYAINYRGGAAIVSAAAGSGKTAVLVERVMRLILNEENKTNADEIVITTFTQKAAAELKARLSTALSKALSENPESVFLREQSLRLNDASISTISSFCLNLIKRNSAMLEISPDFSILDESEEKLILSKSVDAVIEEFCEKGDRQERERLYDWYGDEDDGAIAEIVAKIYSFSRNLISPREYFDKWLCYYEKPEKYTEDIGKIYFNTHIAEAAKELLNIAADISDDAESSDNDKAKAFAAEIMAVAGIFSDVTKDNLAGKLNNAGKTKIPSTPRSSKDYDNSYLKPLRSDFVNLLDGITEKGRLYLKCEGDIRECYPVLKTLISLTEALDKEYTERKAADNKYDFSDIEILTLKLLRDEKGEPTPAARAIAESTAEIIVDEFQDSNDIQYEIFRLISRNKTNLYFVGDIKQSIYRFRGANPLVFSRLTKDPDFKVISLNSNFRSNDKVISAVNSIFTGQMTEELGDVNYDESCALRQGNTDYISGEEHKAELTVLMGESAGAAREKEAEYIACRILDMVEKGYEITVKKDKRPCRFGDFAVLMGRYSANIHIYKKVFDRYGIPYEAKEESGFTDYSEVKCALSLLKIIDNPYKDKELTEVMMRPPYMFTVDEMARVKLSGGIKHKFLYSGLCKEALTDEKCSRFLAELKELRDYSGENTVENLVRRIYEESDFSTAIISSPDGRKRDENLKLLIHYASVFSEGGGGSLSDFIGFMDSIRKKEVKLTRPQDSRFSDHRIKLMTVHGSKGLEFPVCFVANLSNESKNRENRYICLDPDKGIGMRVIDRENMLQSDTLSYDIVSSENCRLDISEEMRLLYVAATRAKEKLIFTAPRAANSKSEDMHYKWVSRSAVGNSDIFNTEVIENYSPSERKADISDNAEKTIIKPFTEYGYRPFTLIPSKVTATQIGVKSVDDFALKSDKISRFLRTPSFLKEEERGKLTGKKRGDAYHKAMELLDFGGDCTQLDSLMERGKLTAIERISIDDEDISAFLCSSLCKRAVASGKIRREAPIFCEYDPKLWGDFGISGWEKGEERPFVQGIADMYFVEEGEIVLVDYKTNVNVTPGELIEEYRGQLSIYKTALEEMTGMRVKECYLYSFWLDEAIGVSV